MNPKINSLIENKLIITESNYNVALDKAPRDSVMISSGVLGYLIKIK